MEREELISKISGKIGRTNVTEQTIGNYVDTFPLPQGEEPTDEYITKVANYFSKTISGNISLEAANAVKPLNEQIENLKEQIENLKKDTTIKKDQAGNEALTQLQQMLSELKTQNDEFKNQFTSLTAKQTEEDLKKQVIAKLKEKNADDEYVLQNTFIKHGKLDTSKSIDELVSTLTAEYDAEFTACRGKGAKPRSNSGIGGSSVDNSAAQAKREEYRQQLIKAGKIPKKEV